MEVLEVLSGNLTDDPTLLDLKVKVKYVDGREETLPYGYRADDPVGIAPQVKAWFDANPKFKPAKKPTA